MRCEAFRVKIPVWVRIVNPEPIRILDMTWRYGSYVRAEPGGVFRTVTGEGARRLAMYQPPHAPSQQDDAPPDALVLHTLADLRLLAEGQISFEEPYETSLPQRGPEGPAKKVRIGDCGFVPRSRAVRAMYPPTVLVRPAGGPYREGLEVTLRERPSQRCTIRPGGAMTVFTFDGEPPRGLLKVRYRVNPEWIGEQCESGAWFYVAEDEFLRMKDDASRIAELEELERAVVISMLRSL